MKRQFEQMYGKGEFKEFEAYVRREQSGENQVKACWQCGQPESSLGPGQRLRVCAGCMAVNRKIFYCSRYAWYNLYGYKTVADRLRLSECQTKSWKHGIPIPHKTVCGKLIEDNVRVAADQSPVPDVDDPANNARIPPADPSFKRSPALLHQISFLTQPPYVDYTVCCTSDPKAKSSDLDVPVMTTYTLFSAS